MDNKSLKKGTYAVQMEAIAKGMVTTDNYLDAIRRADMPMDRLSGTT